MPTKVHIVTDGQSLQDVAVQLLGSSAGAWAIARVNNLGTLTPLLYSGQPLLYRTEDEVVRSVSGFFAASLERVNSSFSMAPKPGTPLPPLQCSTGGFGCGRWGTTLLF